MATKNPNCKIADKEHNWYWQCSDCCPHMVEPDDFMKNKGFFCAYQKMPSIKKMMERK